MSYIRSNGILKTICGDIISILFINIIYIIWHPLYLLNLKKYFFFWKKLTTNDFFSADVNIKLTKKFKIQWQT